jgi:hypothetical protein
VDGRARGDPEASLTSLVSFSARSSTATVVVYVSDDNDNSPYQIARGVDDVLYVEENCAVGTVVGRVSATDEDVERNAELTYAFSNGLSVDNFLRIDARTGGTFSGARRPDPPLTPFFLSF